MSELSIAGRRIPRTEGPIYFIAEIGLCHNGSVDIAKALIDLAADAGADAVKFQKRTVDDLATPDVLAAEDRRFPSFGRTYREVREHIEFGRDEYDAVFAHAKKRNIPCFVTPFDETALHFLDRYDVPAYKLASHSLTDLPLLREVAKKGKPVVLSTGMASLDELDEGWRVLRDAGIPMALLHCVSSYPTQLEQANLKAIDTLEARYGEVTGFSGHERGFLVTLAAAARGARVIERHVTLDHSLEGFDHVIALDPPEMRSLVGQLRQIEKMLGTGAKALADEERPTREKYRRSIAARSEIREGELITPDKVIMLNPGTGLPPRSLPDVVGRPARRAIRRHELIQPGMF